MRRKGWEYHSVRFDSGTSVNLDEWLNAFGSFGWELIAVRDQRYYFKRGIKRVS